MTGGRTRTRSIRSLRLSTEESIFSASREAGQPAVAADRAGVAVLVIRKVVVAARPLNVGPLARLD
jgi:hypothetical protein